jgi:carboxypeptidase T
MHPLSTHLCRSRPLPSGPRSGNPWRTALLACAAATVVLFIYGVPAARAESPALVEVDLTTDHTLSDLLRAGLDVVNREGSAVRLLARQRDLARIASLGLTARIVDPNPGRTYAARTRAELAARPTPKATPVRSAVDRDGKFRTNLLPPFGSGSMGGFWTAAEIKMKLDSLVAQDTQGLVANKIDTLGYSRQNRPIWGLRIGKAASPVVFLNALTHAREPEGMQSVFYFIDHLLSNYSSDAFATHLLNQRAIYIVPLVNPDGYAVNETTYTNSGGTQFGFWRKNTRDNNGGGWDELNDGVDINRNFGYNWGWDNEGSSPDRISDAYRGPSAFSEPETRAQRDIVVALDPITGFSVHTSGDMLLYSWEYEDIPSPDEAMLAEWSDEMTRKNAYLGGRAGTVLYVVNGGFNDWAYGDVVLKPRCYSFVPEIGNANDGFWPPPSRIVPLAEEMLHSYYTVAAIAGPYLQADLIEMPEGAMNAGRLTNIRVRARNLGAQGAPGPVVFGSLAALDAGANVLNGATNYPLIAPRTSAHSFAPFQVALDDTVTPGRLMRFQVTFTADNLFSRDTIVIPAGTPTILFTDGASAGTGNWTITPAGTWGVIQNDPAHPSRYFEESPAGTYTPSANSRLTLTPAFNFSNVVHAYAFYEAAWEFEENQDFGTIEASTDGLTFFSVPATGTTPGSGLGFQTLGLPVYAGARRTWQPEIADLSTYTGAGKTAVRLRFRVRSNGSINFDGLAFDSLRIAIYDPASQPGPTAVGDGPTVATLELSAARPNPARGLTSFELSLPSSGTVRLEILDLQGRRVRTLVDARMSAGRFVQGWDLTRDDGQVVAPGVYLARLTGHAGAVTRRVVVF